ncbi:hypothetical protein HN446_02895 [bacterium]|jgi:hypothetical protein|nr:hypothetical protein [bacterium]
MVKFYLIFLLACCSFFNISCCDSEHYRGVFTKVTVKHDFIAGGKLYTPRSIISREEVFKLCGKWRFYFDDIAVKKDCTVQMDVYLDGRLDSVWCWNEPK